MIEGLRDDARDTGVDNSSRAAGLANQDISYEFFSHGSVVFEKGWKQREGQAKRRGPQGGKPKFP
jgi:hypothetical protein